MSLGCLPSWILEPPERNRLPGNAEESGRDDRARGGDDDGRQRVATPLPGDPLGYPPEKRPAVETYLRRSGSIQSPRCPPR